MLAKSIEVEVVRTTFAGEIIPPHLTCPSNVTINVACALLTLGQLTSPSGFSTASPARYWAWLRYFSAISATSDLRITTPFTDLDPHQKTILSDDIGVAISIQWLYDRLGGFAEIVDGRRFMLQYASLIRRPKRKTPKVGIGKCPDFVIRDLSNQWHVLECKGTQSDRAYRNRQLAAAYMQKQVIDVRGAARGDRLAAGIYLASQQSPWTSHLRVIDPPQVEPYVVIDANDRGHATTAAQRLAISRALALSGFGAISEELALPSEEPDVLPELYTTYEKERLGQSPEDRWATAVDSLRADEPRPLFRIGAQQFVGQETIVPIAGEDFYKNTGCRRIRVSQGISTDFVKDLRSAESSERSEIDSLGATYLGDSRIKVDTQGRKTILQNGHLYAARMEFL